MKSIGVVRRLDWLGRILLPKELRRAMDIGKGTGLEMLVDRERIVLKKHEPGCIFCGRSEDVQKFRGKKVCAECLHELGERAKE